MDRLSATNYLNLVAYCFNVAFTYGIGVGGVFGLKTNTEVSDLYPTLITPVGWAFAIWSIIFISQGIFAIIQLFSPFRASALVLQGVGLSYVGVCLSQIVWTIAFSLEIIWLSVIFMLCILFFLYRIVVMEMQVQNDSRSNFSIRDYGLLQFPFSVHAGWITAASFVNISVLLVYLEAARYAQFYVALASLVGFLFVAMIALFYPSRPEYVIPLVLSWATFGIYTELRNPSDIISNGFDADVLDVVKIGSLATSAVILAAVLIRAVIAFVNRRRNQGAGEENVYLRADEK